MLVDMWWVFLAHSCTHSLVSVCVEPTINASSYIEFWFGFNTGFGSWFYYAVFEGVTLNIDPAAKVANNRLLLQLLSSLTLYQWIPAGKILFV